MGQTIWPLASSRQQQALAWAPRLTCLLSILGSCYILFDIGRLKRRNTYHRLIFAMNIMDLVALLAWIMTTWPMPAGTLGVAGAMGTQRTCNVQGFFSQLSISTVLYNACLVIYFMLVIRWGWTEQRITESRWEYYVHFVCLGMGMGTAIASQLLGLYNPSGWQCWIASSPPGCTERWQMTATTTTTTEDYYACERGDNASLYKYFFFYVPLWACILVASLALYQVYWAYRRQDHIAEKWRQKHARRQSSIKDVATDKNKVVALTHPIAAWAEAAMRRKRYPRRRPPDQPRFTRSQIRYMERKRSRAGNDASGSSRYSNTMAVISHTNYLNSQGTSEITATGPVHLTYTPKSSSPSISGPNPNHQRTNVQDLPPVLRAIANAERTGHSMVSALEHTAEKAIQSIRGGTSTEGRTTTRKQPNPKTKMVTSQALLYLCSFVLAWFFPSILVIQESTTEEGIAYYHWVFLVAFFMPLQGLMNFVGENCVVRNAM
jgi:hypothetical protein